MEGITMKNLIATMLALALVGLAPQGARAGNLPEVIAVDSGQIRGTVEEGLASYLGIPYATPPVGPLRWQPPQAVQPWSGVREAKAFGAACHQPKEKADGHYSEDCLTLNVWSPAAAPTAKLPVMVWVHGGAFNFGASSLPEYNGRNLARKGVVVVTLNYRLGPLGFLVHPQLAKESPHGVAGNYGLLDQIAALTWVRHNIAAFGGDPDLVTLFGQSAGSRSVSLQMISPLSTGLFHRAIAQSGGPIIGSQFLSALFNGDMAGASAMGQRLADRMGCAQAADPIAAMRQQSGAAVIKAADVSTSIFDDSGLFFAPVFDGWVLPKNPVSAFSQGRQHPVPFIVGSTRNEGTLYLAEETGLTRAKYRAFLKTRFGAATARALKVFPAATDEAVPGAIDRVITVGANAEPARFVARAMARTPTQAYLFHFVRRPDTAMARRFAVHHGADIAYVFANVAPADGYDATDRALSDAMTAYWINFARTGDPNGPGLPEWPAYRRETDINMEFGDRLRINRHLFERESDFVAKESVDPGLSRRGR